jgi:hypothetical protein
MASRSGVAAVKEPSSREVASLSQSNTLPFSWDRVAPFASAAVALVTGLILRIWMFRHFFQTNGDTLIYGDIAKNLLRHGQYALTVDSGETFPTLIRLPAYPLFLAACFRVFGLENYAPAAWVQIALDLVGCLFLADFARRIAPKGIGAVAGQCTLWLAVLCPFTAIYSASPLTEAPTLFTLALALWAAALFNERPTWRSALSFTIAVTSAALLRPDGALVAIALAPALLFRILKLSSAADAKRFSRMAVACTLLSLSPFALWAGRNWRVFHVFQPLAPRSTTDPGDPLSSGWERWVGTWCLDFVSTYDIAWNVPGEVLDVGKLPSRAFDTQAQRSETIALAEQYNNNGRDLTAEIDAGFAKLAEDRITAHRLRYYVWLPLGRVADMWLRPRVENLPIDLDWWVYAHHKTETCFSWSYVALNALYLSLGFAGLLMRPRLWIWMTAYLFLRSAMLFTVCPPEARYTLECFPMLFALGGIALSKCMGKMATIRQSASY